MQASAIISAIKTVISEIQKVLIFKQISNESSLTALIFRIFIALGNGKNIIILDYNIVIRNEG